ncbi:MAG TPA: UV DNA damage repair endonuclease UvsE [Thermoanaerobaculia bacterium]|nr:UV DNA damage repair endonuclease UvsE [Thermoanaerobaculia bacterium]
MRERRLGFAVKVMGRDLKSHDTRRWQSGPSLGVSIEALRPILDYCAENGIRMYRLSSDFVPYSTHPDLPQFHGQIERFRSELEEVGAHAAKLGMRLSLHPSQYVVLNAEDPEVARKAIADLDVQASLLDVLGQGPEAVVVLHVGGVYGNREESLDRFVTGFRRLSEPARRRLVIENDESSFTVEDCLRLHERTGAPIIFDHQHHRLNPGGLRLEDAARKALASWPDGVRPKIHFSSPRLDAREVIRRGKTVTEAPLLRQHADYVDPWTFADFLGSLGDVDFDVMLEAKAKDFALFRLRDDLRRIGRAEVLQAP